jgi:signal transduction histidine kinase
MNLPQRRYGQNGRACSSAPSVRRLVGISSRLPPPPGSAGAESSGAKSIALPAGRVNHLFSLKLFGYDDSVMKGSFGLVCGTGDDPQRGRGPGLAGRKANVSERSPQQWVAGRRATRASGTGRSLIERVFPSDVGRVVAYARLGLAGFALAAIYIDPTQPSYFSNLTYSILTGYVIYAVVLAVAANFEVIENKGPLVRHLFDFAVCASLTVLTNGPTTPFFVFFTFMMVSGALHWGVKGVAATGAASLGLYIVVSYRDFLAWDGLNLNSVIIRGAYLLIAGLLFAYVGAHRQRIRERLANLAAWPPVEVAADSELSLTALLRHAAQVLGLEHVVVVWEDISEPGWRVSHFNSRDGETGRRHGRIESKLVSDSLVDLAFMATDPAGSHVLTSEGIRHVQAPLVAPGVFNFIQIRNFSSAPFEATHFRGRIFILEPGTLTAELLSLTEIIAGHIGTELEHFGLRRELEQAAASRERSRLARDVHDSILQELTAARLQLAGMAAASKGDARKAIDHAAAILAAQQRRIREFVVGANPKPARASLPLAEAIQPVLGELAGLWQCEISAQFHPERALVTAARLPQIRLILAEAVANAVRHGRATRIDVTIESDTGLWIEVRDNGVTEAANEGSRQSGQIAPFSLRQRVRDLGGGCNLTVGSDGGTLVVALPAA